MMVSISGERGVGKTLHLAERVYQRRMQGYFTITNFSHAFSNLDCSGLSPEEFLAVILNIIDFKDNGYEMFNIHPSFRHTGVYVAMDEATIYFSPEMQSKLSKSNPEQYTRLLNLLAQARKYDVEIDYVVQDPAKVGKDFRRYTEHYKRFRWLFKLKRLAYIPHPRLPIFRREHRHLLDIIWEEVHELDAENPKFNYSTVTDEHGVAQFAPGSTLLSRRLKLTGKYKRHILRMYNSYQPVAVKQQEYRKEYSPLKDFRIIPDSFKKDKLKSLKIMLRAVGLKVPISDEHLPAKIGFQDLLLPPRDEKNRIISEVQSQANIILPVADLQKQIARAYSLPDKQKLFSFKKKQAKLTTPKVADQPKAETLKKENITGSVKDTGEQQNRPTPVVSLPRAIPTPPPFDETPAPAKKTRKRNTLKEQVKEKTFFPSSAYKTELEPLEDEINTETQEMLDKQVKILEEQIFISKAQDDKPKRGRPRKKKDTGGDAPTSEARLSPVPRERRLLL